MNVRQDKDDDVRRLAYFLWEKAGRPTGLEHHFWAEASREIEGKIANSQQAEADKPRSVAR